MTSAAFGWDNPTVRATTVLAGENAEREDLAERYILKFVNFLRTFRIDNEFIYRSVIVDE